MTPTFVRGWESHALLLLDTCGACLQHPLLDKHGPSELDNLLKCDPHLNLQEEYGLSIMERFSQSGETY